MAPPPTEHEIGWPAKRKNSILTARFGGNHHEIPAAQVKLLNKLGSGAVGNVYKARYRGELHAAKVLHPKFGENDEEYKHFAVEIQVLTHLQHPNIVRVVGACTTRADNAPFLLYELLEGGSLQDLFDKNKDTNKRWCPHESKVLRWCMDLMAALAFMHKHKVLHRDVKLANILLSSDQKTLKLGDFGLCRMFESSLTDASGNATIRGSTPTGGDDEMTGMTGTYRYMAPEIFAGSRRYGDRVDVYSAALCMWSICTGVRPFDAVDTAELERGLAARQGGKRPSLDVIQNKELADVISQGWAHSAGERPAASQVLKLLSDVYQRTPAAPGGAKGAQGDSPGCLSFLSRRSIDL